MEIIACSLFLIFAFYYSGLNPKIRYEAIILGQLTSLLYYSVGVLTRSSVNYPLLKNCFLLGNAIVLYWILDAPGIHSKGTILVDYRIVQFFVPIILYYYYSEISLIQISDKLIEWSYPILGIDPPKEIPNYVLPV